MSTDEQIMVFPVTVFDTLNRFQGINFKWDEYLKNIMLPDVIQFRSRGKMEDDPSFKQIIPYVIIQYDDKLLHYTRGKKSGEKRLVSKGSIGIGGHVSNDDISLFHDEDLQLWEIYKAAVEREVFEELKINSEYEERIVAVLNDDSNSVGQVHFGIVHLWTLNSPDVYKNEQQITQLEFISLSELKNKIDSLESWSAICLKNIENLLIR